ncbi:Membrane carboxypeptidase [uncultured Desulfobacterium sp.]|uniref:peptidoglycan glycosyltransferase n=1 Tax=uncultured Desulfobacterium sp. TaxID=201089 RepID=A0A445N3B4_9BACT|nr:Membrane carboxypeptidase [uncultured Desulfobacterium sp.]
MKRNRAYHLRRFFLHLLVMTPLYMILLGLIFFVVGNEIKTSKLQAKIFTRIASKLTYRNEAGKSNSICFPAAGPFDLRMGYSQIPEWVSMLEKRYEVKLQARFSPLLLELTQWGLFPPYHEKTQVGLNVSDCSGEKIFEASYPQRVYKSFDSIPSHVVNALLYIENRELLDNRYPWKNPAVDWGRLGRSVIDLGLSIVDEGHKKIGGSTLATQLEKYRHSPEGVTGSVVEKLRQMVSASLRSYMDGPWTLNTRKRIVLDYINSIPLAAAAGYGEVNGLGDGLWAWFGADFDEVNSLLGAGKENIGSGDLGKTALAYRQMLSLFLAHRRPSAYLITERSSLHELADSYLKLMADDGFISTELRDAALQVRPVFRKDRQFNYPSSSNRWKAVNLLRTKLLSTLDVPNFYMLDRLDLSTQSTIRMDIQEEVTEVFKNLKRPDVAYAAGLRSHYLLETGDPSNLIYSFSLYESGKSANYLRVQTNNYDGPFNIDESMKLDLGSTAKFRTLVNYLEIIADLHNRYSEVSRAVLDIQTDLIRKDGDRLTLWALEYLSNSPDKGLRPMLEAAVDRTYSASPAESFFTAGGLHTFHNFHKTDDTRIMTVREAFRNSVNLVFIRLMRDIANHYMFQAVGLNPAHLEFMEEAERRQYLMKFADREGKTFLNRFYQKYANKKPEEAFDRLVSGIQNNPARLAAVYRFVKSSDGIEKFSDFITDRLPNSTLSPETLYHLYEKYGPDSFSLADRGYIARIHPLELWVVRYKYSHPDAGLTEFIGASAKERQEVYKWLFKTRYKGAQIRRIRTILELESFQVIHKEWKKLGYPFDFLVPSYATSIGSSADRPHALADLIGIIVNDGVKYPVIRFERLHFAKDTPYETILEPDPSSGERVLPAEVAKVVKGLLLDVVQAGTARRVANVLLDNDGKAIDVGGKTGTGDNRYKTFGAGAQLIGSKVVSRTAVFVFLIGDRFYGVLTAYVAGEEAERYSFTSALPVQVLKILWPKIKPLITG